MAADIIFTRAESFAPLASPSTCFASAVSATPRAAPVFCSAASSAAEIAVVRSEDKPFPRTSWSRYDRTTTNAAGHTSFGCVVDLYC